MKLKLDLKERISLAMLLPDSGSYLSVLIAEEIKEKVQPTMEEIEQLEIKQEGTALTWNAEKDLKNVREFNFTKPEIELLKKRVKEIDDAQQVSAENFKIIHKIMQLNDSKGSA